MDKANGLCDLKTLISLLVLSIFVFFLFLVITLDFGKGSVLQVH